MRQLVAGGLVDFFGLGLVEKVAGIAAAAGRAWPDGETHFENALHTADEMPHRVEQPEVRRWYARMLLERDGPGDRERARTLLAESPRRLRSDRHAEARGDGGRVAAGSLLIGQTQRSPARSSWPGPARRRPAKFLAARRDLLTSPMID